MASLPPADVRGFPAPHDALAATRGLAAGTRYELAVAQGDHPAAQQVGATQAAAIFQQAGIFGRGMAGQEGNGQLAQLPPHGGEAREGPGEEEAEGGGSVDARKLPVSGAEGFRQRICQPVAKADVRDLQPGHEPAQRDPGAVAFGAEIAQGARICAYHLQRRERPAQEGRDAAHRRMGLPRAGFLEGPGRPMRVRHCRLF